MKNGNDFPTRLTELIKEKSSQKELAKYVGSTKQSISLYANGKRMPDIEILNKICDFFKVSSDYLLGRTDFRGNDVEDQQIYKKLGLSERSIKVLEGYNKVHKGFGINLTLNQLLDEVFLPKDLMDESKYSNIREVIKKIRRTPQEEEVLNNYIEADKAHREFMQNHFDLLSEIGMFLNLINSDPVRIVLTRNIVGTVKINLFSGEGETCDEINETVLEDLEVLELIDYSHMIKIQNILQDLKKKNLKDRITKKYLLIEEVLNGQY